jgi:ribosome-binding factor A
VAGRGASRRPEQVAEAIRAVLAEALVQGELRDPRVGLVTVSGVEVTRDLSVATVRVAPHGDSDAAREEAIDGLQSAAGYLRRMVAKALTTRTVPELRFVRDRGLEHARRIDELLAGADDREDAP